MGWNDAPGGCCVNCIWSSPPLHLQRKALAAKDKCCRTERWTYYPLAIQSINKYIYMVFIQCINQIQ